MCSSSWFSRTALLLAVQLAAHFTPSHEKMLMNNEKSGSGLEMVYASRFVRVHLKSNLVDRLGHAQEETDSYEILNH